MSYIQSARNWILILFLLVIKKIFHKESTSCELVMTQELSCYMNRYLDVHLYWSLPAFLLLFFPPPSLSLFTATITELVDNNSIRSCWVVVIAVLATFFPLAWKVLIWLGLSFLLSSFVFNYSWWYKIQKLTKTRKGNLKLQFTISQSFSK